MTEQLCRALLDRDPRPELLVLSGHTATYADMVARAKFGRPWLRVLMYAHGAVIHEDGGEGMNFGSWFPVCLPNALAWGFTKLSNGNAYITGQAPNRVFFANLGSTAYQDEYVDHHAALVESSGADGMISDNFRGEANDVADEVVNGAELSAGMADAARTLETKLKTRLGPRRLVLFNGVWAHKGDWQPALQMSLAQTSDGCSFEHFARGPDGFDVDGDTWRKWGLMLNEQRATDLARARITLIRGNYPGDPVTYPAVMAAARYAFGTFYLGWVRGVRSTSFTFNQHLQLQRLFGHRVSGNGHFNFQDMRMGRPMGTALKEGSGPGEGWTMRTTGGYVHVNPRDPNNLPGVARRWLAPVGGWLPSGEVVMRGQALTVQPGDAAILCTAGPPPFDNQIVLDVSDFTAASGDKEWLLQVGWHDRRYRTMRVVLRATPGTTDAVFVARLETDSPSRMYGRYELHPVGGTANPAGDPVYGCVPHIGADEILGPTWTANGLDQVITVDLTSPALGFTVFAVRSCRLMGTQAANVTLVSLTLTDPEIIADPSRPAPPV
jgi:hypothetical protein